MAKRFTKQTDKVVAETILAQMGGKRFAMMTGAKNFVAGDLSLRFNIPGSLTKKHINTVIVTLDEAADLYVMEFGKFSKKTMEFTSISKVKGVYCDMLEDIFETETGLLTHF
ncbi:hypothetical protein phiOC_p058 [Ochrobactrum phage vB_OspM_OC]|nr:hypothetical protein phiOC_p058 [Ochrobactrum phage vB_OspM_OC]